MLTFCDDFQTYERLRRVVTVRKPIWITLLISAAALLGACDTATQVAENIPPTATLAPNVSSTPRFTATPIPSRTPLPTDTLTPSPTIIPPTETNTFTPSPTPPILGSVNSVQSINMREGPGVDFTAIEALSPATRVEILGRNTDGQWLNIRIEDGREGWVSSNLIRFQPTATPVPSLTPTPNLTALALGTPLPTALFGGGTITPTPPRSISVASPTPVGTEFEETEAPPLNAATAVSQLPQLPDLESIANTATALAGGGDIPRATEAGLGGPTGGPLLTSTRAPTLPPGTVSSQTGVDVLAYCDDTSFGSPPPRDLAAGSTIDVFWVWFARTRQQVEDHIAAAQYDVLLDGVPLDWRNYRGSIREQDDGTFAVSWFVPTQPLTAGEHRIDYRVSWSRAISDGFAQFGPNTSTPVETGSCTFTVR